MPLIAITRCARLADYVESVRQAGGDVVEVDAEQDVPADVIARADGLLLTGGGDVDPEHYDEPAHATFEAAEPGRDAFEMACLLGALQVRRPILAICRGMQVLNVTLGGTLIQDVPSQVPGALRHTLAPPKDLVAHDITVAADSRLFQLVSNRIVDGERCPVNSRHHQAVKDVAAGLRVVATAPDGVIEAVELTGAAFCVGVQWHPENFCASGGFAPLFAGFVIASTARTR